MSQVDRATSGDKIEIKEGFELIKDYWFNNGTGTMGIVLARDLNTKETKYYMGVAKGLDREIDIRTIMDYGSKLNFNMMRNIFK